MSEPILKLPLRVDSQFIDDASGVCIVECCAVGKIACDHAREIVRRCNSFDALLAACESCWQVTGETIAGDVQPAKLLAANTLARAAIAAAQKEVK